jgi:hypothetical protein
MDLICLVIVQGNCLNFDAVVVNVQVGVVASVVVNDQRGFVESGMVSSVVAGLAVSAFLVFDKTTDFWETI